MKWILTVVLAGLAAAGPFLTTRATGTSEAYNYSLAVADAVTQARAGEWPVLVGQTEFAFNGRIHPVRTAPYLTAFACALDLLTFHQLGFWTLQNLTLALSLLAGALTCYWALRRVTPVAPDTAALLAAAYILSPGVLAPVYAMDLYMTVMTVPFIPLALAANLVLFQRRTFAGLAWLAATLAACWLAHPPVALWLCVATGLIQLIALLFQRPQVRDFPAALGAALLFLTLAGFGLASALTITPYGDITHVHDTSSILREVHRAFPDSLRPVSAQANKLTDFQLGFFYWACAGAALGLAVWRRNAAALALLAVTALFLVLLIPVPGLTAWLWDHAPTLFLNLTNQWPMQRLYLPMTALVLFALALVWRPPNPTATGIRDFYRILLVVAAGWTGWQSWHFIGRGFSSRLSPAATLRSHFSSNLELTLISYAILGTPGDYTNGVMDPEFDFRLTAAYGSRELASNWTAPLPASPENLRGTLVATPGDSPDVLDLSRHFTLQPGARYRLTLKFLVAPAEAILQLRGVSLFRQHPLPAAGGPRGFGMRPGNNPSLTVWTSQSTPEVMDLRVVGPGLANGPWRGLPFVEFTFERIDPHALPVELQSLLPLRAVVRAAEPGYLLTPRMFIAGYAATVNARPVRVQSSIEGRLMLAVPAGESQVEVHYVGPTLVRWTYRLACLGWAGIAVWGLLCWGPARVRQSLREFFASTWARARTRAAAVPRRGWLTAAGALLLLAGAGLGWHEWQHYRQAVGPVRIRFVLPRSETNRQQPLLVTGRYGAGTFIYAVYLDADHVRIGIDVWGRFGHETEPIKVDYFAEHEVVIDSGALYPSGHPALRDVPPAALARLRNHLRVELDGQTVFEREINPYESQVREVTIGRNLLGGSTCEAKFVGEILAVQRLPLSAPPR
jgi:hypothetical protein